MMDTILFDTDQAEETVKELFKVQQEYAEYQQRLLQLDRELVDSGMKMSPLRGELSKLLLKLRNINEDTERLRTNMEEIYKVYQKVEKENTRLVTKLPEGDWDKGMRKEYSELSSTWNTHGKGMQMWKPSIRTIFPVRLMQTYQSNGICHESWLYRVVEQILP